MTLKNLLIITGAVSIATGLIYLLGFYGPTEAEVKNWAMSAIIAGLISIGFSNSKFKKIWIIVSAVFGYGLLLVAQVLPIYMWFTAPMLNDKQSDFVISAWYSAPHFLIGLLALFSIVKILKTKN